ncbi:hypothetical protein DFJ74DRAFT_478155 [Hyaloraphidium curvatum]|nr:hypothetical protein DFJ74DRAFT_478155 [Hyaloraphidium curvatum]
MRPLELWKQRTQPDSGPCRVPHRAPVHRAAMVHRGAQSPYGPARALVTLVLGGLVAASSFPRPSTGPGDPHCIVVSTLCARGHNGPTNQILGLVGLLPFARGLEQGTIRFFDRGKEVALRCASARVALPQFRIMDNWMTDNTDAGILFNLSVSGLDERDSRTLWVFEDEALAALARQTESPVGRPPPVVCATQQQYHDAQAKFMSNVTLMREFFAFMGRKLPDDMSVFGEFRCWEHFSFTTEAPASAGVPNVLAPPGGTDLVFVGVPWPLRSYYPLVVPGFPGKIVGAMDEPEHLPFNAWVQDLGADVARKALAGKPQIPFRPESLDRFLAAAEAEPDPRRRGLSHESLAALRGLQSCLSPGRQEAAPLSLPTFAGVQMRRGDATNGICMNLLRNPAKNGPVPCGVNLTRLPELTASLPAQMPVLLATDANGPDRETIWSAIPHAIDFRPLLPAHCTESMPRHIVHLLVGLMVQFGLACGDEIRFTPVSTFSEMIAHLGEAGNCGKKGRAKMVPPLIV